MITIKLQLKANNESKGEPIILTAGDDGIWQADELKYTWTDLPKYENEKEINYTVEELDVENGYNVTYNTETARKVLITNTHTPEKTKYSVEKIWSDNNNQDGKRPTSIQIQLKAGDSNIGDPITLTVGENGIWDADDLKYTWTNLPKYEDGVEIKYSAIEVTVPSGYNATYNTETTGKTIITNSYTPEQTEYSIEKVWNDSENQDGKRPTTIKLQLKANGVVIKTAELSAGDNGIWEESELKYTWSNLPKFADGVEIVYSVEEIEMTDDYSVSYDNSTAGKTIVTNTHTTETTSYSIEKEWADNNNQDGIRPRSIKIQLKADDENYGDVIILNADEGNSWDASNSKYTWSNLPKYENGKEITDLEEHHRHKERSLLSSTTTTTHDEVHAVKAQKSIIEGNTVSLQGGKDISLTGSAVASTKETALSAGRNISIHAAEETDKEIHKKQVKKSGLIGSGLGFTIGSEKKKDSYDTEETMQAGSTVGSVKGNVTIHAGQTASVRASDIIAGKDTLITGRNVDIESKDNIYRGKEEHEYKKSGLTVSLGGAAVNTARDTAASIKRAD